MYHLIKCECGRENLAKPKLNKTIEQTIELKLCLQCRRKGQWKILSTNETLWN
ncbi:MAG TPA: hypothetical protein VFX18_03000 [Candidatus Nitrosocosmicus sp.]|nr:hypothetical protein [Candidatus Nitrosocosmicus sp.]